MIWWIIDRLRYPKCYWRPCGNNKNKVCNKLDLKKYLECMKTLRRWGRY